jgi:hypothetical protein
MGVTNPPRVKITAEVRAESQDRSGPRRDLLIYFRFKLGRTRFSGCCSRADGLHVWLADRRGRATSATIRTPDDLERLAGRTAETE